MFPEPELSFRPRLERFAEGFLRDHLGSLECRVRNDHAKCSGADDRDSDGNDRSDRELRNAVRMLIPLHSEARSVPVRL